VKTASSICKGVVVAAVVLLAVGSWAESKGALQLQHSASVGDKTLAMGNYTVRWEGTGDQVELKIYKGKELVASVPARVIQLSSPAPYSSAVVNEGGNGGMLLSEIRFGGKKFALQINSAGGGSGSSGASR